MVVGEVENDDVEILVEGTGEGNGVGEGTGDGEGSGTGDGEGNDAFAFAEDTKEFVVPAVNGMETIRLVNNDVSVELCVAVSVGRPDIVCDCKPASEVVLKLCELMSVWI